MTRDERVRYEMLGRVAAFGARHQELFPESSDGGLFFGKVAAAAAAIEAHAVAKKSAAREGRMVKAAARRALKQLMLAVARTARNLARRVPGLENKHLMPARSSDVELLSSARTFVDHGAAVEAQFRRLGLPATWLADLKQAADAFEVAMRSRSVGRSDVAAGQAGITNALADGLEAVRTLDVIVANTLADNPALLAGWKRDRRVMDPKRDDAKSGDEASAPTVKPDEPSAEEGVPPANGESAGEQRRAS